MKNNSENKYPRILVISNNAFSSTSNNGKTLASFFDKLPAENIAQLYFNPEIPDHSYYHNYFRITDKEIVKCIFRKSDTCGEIIDRKAAKETNTTRDNKDNVIRILKKYNIVRIIREILWMSKKWKTELLDQWLNEFSPEVVFFCAGDSGFAYDITKYIQKKYNTKLVVYITDDYVLPRKTLSLFWWLRRNYILKKMGNAIQESDLFITISQSMKEEYKKIFGKDSILALNMTESLRDESIPKENKTVLTLVYTGGFHFKRYITLNLLAQSLKKYNHDIKNKQKAYLKIYSNQEPSNKVLKYLNIKGASEFCGSLNAEQLKKVLNSSDILVHVESFGRKSIESTRLSISTKIPEYLSLGKPVLAIGPSEIASIKYLEDCAFCITDPDNIYSDLEKLLNDSELRKELAVKALRKYDNNHKKEIVSKKLISSIVNLCDK